MLLPCLMKFIIQVKGYRTGISPAPKSMKQRTSKSNTMKNSGTNKHSWTYRIGSGLGALLIIGGLVWTCQQSVIPRIVSASDGGVHNGSVSALSHLTSSQTQAKTRQVNALEQPGTSFDMLPIPSEIGMPLENNTLPSAGEAPNALSLLPAQEAPEYLAQVPDAAADTLDALPPIELPSAPIEPPAVPIEPPAVPIEQPAVPIEQPAVPAEQPTTVPGNFRQINQPPITPERQTAAPAAIPAPAVAPAPAVVSTPHSSGVPNQPGLNAPASDTNATGTSPRLEYITSLLSKIVPMRNSRPGDAALEREQKAELSIEKILPNEVQIGCEETCKVIVRNIGKTVAKNVVLWDQLPSETTLVSTTPAIRPTEEGELIWTGFDLNPDEERVFEYRIIPQSEGVIGSVASVSFQTEASGKTNCTRPVLQLHVSAPDQVLAGENLRLEIEISNTGTGAARNVVLHEEVPDGFTHKSGKKLDNEIGILQPGETKRLALTLQAKTAGQVVNHMSVTGHGQASAENELPVTVTAPELALEIQGSKIRYLERETSYILKVWNPGTAIAKNVRLTAQLPPQMKFVRTNNEGVYQESSHSVYWELVELPDNVAPGDIELVLLPSEIGSGQINFHGEGEGDLATDTSCEVSIVGMAALSYSVVSLSDPVEVGHDAVYEIRLSNRGTKESRNIVVGMELPESMEVVEVDGPTNYSNSGGNIGQFGTLNRIAAKEEVVYRLTTRCSEPGDHRIKISVSSDEMEPLVKEESIRIYGSN